MLNYALDEKTLCVPMFSRLVENRFGHEDRLSEEVREWAELCGLQAVLIFPGFEDDGVTIRACRYIEFSTPEDAMVFKLKWL